MGRGSKARWITFVIVQVGLAVVWWYVALGITISTAGVRGFAASAQFGVFGVLVVVSVGLHLGAMLGDPGSH